MDAIDTLREALGAMTPDEQFFVVGHGAAEIGIAAPVGRDAAVADFCNVLRAKQVAGTVEPADVVGKVVRRTLDALRRPTSPAATAQTVGASSFAPGGPTTPAGPVAPGTLLGKLLDLMSRLRVKPA